MTRFSAYPKPGLFPRGVWLGVTALVLLAAMTAIWWVGFVTVLRWVF